MKESDLAPMAKKIKRFARQQGKDPMSMVQEFHKHHPDATTKEAFAYFSTGNSPRGNTHHSVEYNKPNLEGKLKGGKGKPFYNRKDRSKIS